MNSLRQYFRERLAIAPGDAPGEFAATLTLAADFALFPDHFPGQPVLPGVCLLQLVLAAAEAHLHLDQLLLRRVATAKFLAPVLPGQTLTLRCQSTSQDDGTLIIKASIASDDHRAAAISVVAAR